MPDATLQIYGPAAHAGGEAAGAAVGTEAPSARAAHLFRFVNINLEIVSLAETLVPPFGIVSDARGSFPSDSGWGGGTSVPSVVEDRLV